MINLYKLPSGTWINIDNIATITPRSFHYSTTSTHCRNCLNFGNAKFFIKSLPADILKKLGFVEYDPDKDRPEGKILLQYPSINERLGYINSDMEYETFYFTIRLLGEEDEYYATYKDVDNILKNNGKKNQK